VCANRYGHDGFRPRSGLKASGCGVRGRKPVIASVCLLLMSSEIARGGLLRPGAPESARHPDHAASVAIIIAFLVSIPVSFFTEWAFALWATAPLLTRVLRRLPASARRITGSPDRRPAARDGS
jgi:hypothetical protein